MRVTTNNQPRDILDALDLSATERQQFDYLDWSAIERGEESASFFRYRGSVYSLGDVMRGGPEGWDGSIADSFFSGIVVRIVDDGERVIVGLALS